MRAGRWSSNCSVKGRTGARRTGAWLVLLLGAGLAQAQTSAADAAAAPDGVQGVVVQAMQARAAAGAEPRDGHAPRVGLELQRVDPVLDDPQGSTARLYRLDRTPQAEPSQELRTRLWVGNHLGGLGAGADWSATPAGSSLRPWRPVLGLRADVSNQTRLIYEVRGPASSLASVPGSGATESEVRWALEFKKAPSAASHLRNGLLRVQLSNSSSLVLRPRSGGVMVSYRSQF